jgi:hypothetical protein
MFSCTVDLKLEAGGRVWRGASGAMHLRRFGAFVRRFTSIVTLWVTIK